jgi:hypothetical protein
MIKRISKKFKKKVYHILTSGNADIAFYTEAYVAGNKEWIMKKPIIFAINLIKININCLVLHRKFTLKDLLPGKKCIARIHRRPKVYQYSMALMCYPCIITDIFGSLLELTVDMDLIYQRIEEKYNLPGFRKLRKEYDNNFKSIKSIYELISKELDVRISEAVEIRMFKKHLVLNPYLKKAFEIAAYNRTNIVGILETSYSKENVEEILEEFSIKLYDIYVSNECMLPFYKMRNEYVRNYKNKDEAIDEEIIVVSADYNKAFKRSRGYHIAQRYYRSSKEIMKSIPVANLTKEFKEVYQTISGIELFGGQYNHKNIYESTYLYLAPAIYALLEQTYQKVIQSGVKIIALCDSECIFVSLYEKYFGEINTCIWSAFAGAIPTTEAEWNNLLEDCCFLESYPADRIAHSLGFSFQNQLLKNCKKEFIEVALHKSRLKDKKVINSYLKDCLGNEKRIVVIDPMPGLSSLDNFSNYAHEINPQIEIDEISMSRFLNKDTKELDILHRILQMDTPYVIGIYGDEVDAKKDGIARPKEITFTQPKFIEDIKKETIVQALDDYCNAFSSYQHKNSYLSMNPSDINEILNYAKDGLIQLEEVLGGYLE